MLVQICGKGRGLVCTVTWSGERVTQAVRRSTSPSDTSKPFTWSRRLSEITGSRTIAEHSCMGSQSHLTRYDGESGVLPAARGKPQQNRAELAAWLSSGPWDAAGAAISFQGCRKLLFWPACARARSGGWESTASSETLSCWSPFHTCANP